MARGNRRASAIFIDSADLETARLELLEGFLSRSEIADCTEYALDWLADTLNISQSICLARREGEAALTAVGAYGLPTNAAWSIPSRVMSAAYSAAPVTFSRPSTRRSGTLRTSVT